MSEDPGVFEFAPQLQSVGEVGAVVAPPSPAMSEDPGVSQFAQLQSVGEVGAVVSRARSRPMAGGDRGRLRKSPRLIRKKELSACASDMDLILKLKEEAKALNSLKLERLAREGLLDAYMYGHRKFMAANEAPPPAEPVEDGEPPATGTAGKKKRKVVKRLVPPELVDCYVLIQHSNPFNGICDGLELGKRSKKFQEFYAERMAIWNKDLEYQQAIIKQFRTKGYAYDYSEVTDDDK
jgi:hypothetical protein